VDPGQILERIGASRGVLYLSDPSFANFARLRQRVGPASYSLCGVTHTLATAGTQQMIADLSSEEVMPWDALVCTSNAALETVRRCWRRRSTSCTGVLAVAPSWWVSCIDL
jgi:hypothetical protein